MTTVAVQALNAGISVHFDLTLVDLEFEIHKNKGRWHDFDKVSQHMMTRAELQCGHIFPVY